MDYIKISFVDNPEGIDSEFRRTVEEMLLEARPRFSLTRKHWQPQIDIYETREEIVILAEVAGIPREEIQLEIATRTLRLSGVRRYATREGSARYCLAEIAFGRFERTVALPVPVDTQTATATCRDGLLEIRLGKRPLDRIQKITIQRS